MVRGGEADVVRLELRVEDGTVFLVSVVVNIEWKMDVMLFRSLFIFAVSGKDFETSGCGYVAHGECRSSGAESDASD